MRMTPDARAALVRAGHTIGTPTRRTFLTISGALVVGFSTATLANRLGLAQPPGGGRGSAGTPPLDAWIAIAADGTVTAYTGKCELGQGIGTAQVQLVAEELSVPIARVRLIQCDTSRTPDQGTTSGSQSTPTNFNTRNLAQAAATARETLLGLAAGRLGVPAADLTLDGGAIVSKRDA
jgi:CO/xanthine dehydrogenase Mo-binding subunit